MLRSLCGYVGVPLLEEPFPNEDFLVKRNFSGENVTGFQVLRWIAEAGARFGRMDGQGRLRLGWYQEASFSLDRQVFASLDVADYQCAPIDKVQVRSTETDIGVVVPPDDESRTNLLAVTENPLLYAESDGELRPAAEGVYQAVREVSYRPYRVELLWEIPLLRAGMILSMETRGGERFPAYIMSRSLQGGRDSYEAVGYAVRQAQSSPVNQSLQKLRGKANELTRTIEETNSRLTDTAGKLESQITQTAREIRAEVTAGDNALQSSITQTASQIRAEVKSGDDKLQSSITQTATSIQSEIKTVNGNVSAISQKVNGISATVSGQNGKIAEISASVDDVESKLSLKADKVEVQGFVSFKDLETSGSTTINGDNITTGTLDGVTLLSTGPRGNVIIENGRIYFSSNETPDDDFDAMIYGTYQGSGTGNLKIDAPGADAIDIYVGPGSDSIGGVAGLSLDWNGGHYLSGHLGISGDLWVDGSKNCRQVTAHYGSRFLSAYEMPTAYFGDVGEGTVENGTCRIEVDPILLECGNFEIDYQVFLSPYGPGNVFVSERDSTGFTVGGDDISFGWEVKAKRRGHEDERLKPFDDSGNVVRNFANRR